MESHVKPILRGILAVIGVAILSVLIISALGIQIKIGIILGVSLYMTFSVARQQMKKYDEQQTQSQNRESNE